MKYIFLFSIIAFSLILGVSCKDSIPKKEIKESYIELDSTEFVPSWEKPYTQDLKYYSYAISYWKDPFSENYVGHFPTQLNSLNKYDFFFTPRILQGGSRIEFKIEFQTINEATSFFEQYSNDFEIEETGNTIKHSMYCYDKRFATDSTFTIIDMERIRLLHPIWCGGKGDRKLGGILSSIYINKEKKTVFCAVTDRR